MDINIRFSADDRLLNSLDYLSGWMCTLYKLVKQQEPKRLFPPAGLPTLEPEERAKLDEMVGLPCASFQLSRFPRFAAMRSK